MPRSWRFAATAGLLLTGACRPSVDVAAATATLLATDRAWAQLAGANGNADSIVAYWTADARVILPGQPVVIGTEALRGMVGSLQAVPGFHITWTPDSAVVEPSGAAGYTYGTNRITTPDAKGVLHTTEGRYVTWWRLEADGRWRCSVDISNEGPAPGPAAGAR